ncbi:MAG: hypothetical protein D6726_11205 [Nitrospirae bacterium]|nr:MAG: hypothetical protein D6726_11205 [Nitrospirota bacterium]
MNTKQTSTATQTDTRPAIPDHKDGRKDAPVPIELLIDYRAQGLSYAEIAKLVNRRKQTIHERLKPYDEHILGLKKYKSKRADILAVYQQKILKHLTDEKLKKTPAAQLITMFAILYDKERLERGQSTSNVAVLEEIIHKVDASRGSKQPLEVGDNRGKLGQSRPDNDNNLPPVGVKSYSQEKSNNNS